MLKKFVTVFAGLTQLQMRPKNGRKKCAEALRAGQKVARVGAAL